MIICVTLKRN